MGNVKAIRLYRVRDSHATHQLIAYIRLNLEPWPLNRVVGEGEIKALVRASQLRCPHPDLGPFRY